MLYPTHLLIGILFFLTSHTFFKGGNIIPFFIITIIFSIFPDIDEEHSFINKATGPVGVIIAGISRHRGVFHSLPLYLILFGLCTFFWSNYYAWAILIGYFAHLIGDIITPMGVTPLYPFSTWRMRGLIRVGGLLEGIILIFLITLVIWKLWF